MDERMNAGRAHFLAVAAQACLATRERQRTGQPPLGGGPDDPVGAREAGFAEAVVEMAGAISALEFEVAALRGLLPPMAPPLTPLEVAEASASASEVAAEAADFYGYHGGDYHLLIGDVGQLEDMAFRGDAGAARAMALRANARAREILRLRTAEMGDGAPDMGDTSADAVLARSILGARYAVLLADAMPLAARAASGDVEALCSLTTRCRSRASQVMCMARRVASREPCTASPSPR